MPTYSTRPTLTATSPLRIKPYSERQGNGSFSVALGYFIQLITNPLKQILWPDTRESVVMGSDSFQNGMSDVPSRGDCQAVRCVPLDQPGLYGLAVLRGEIEG